MAAARTHPLLALVSAEVSVLVRKADDNAIARQIRSLPVPGLLVSSSFPNAAEALCWLTSSVPADVVRAIELGELLGPHTGTCEDDGWLAVVS